MFLIASLILLWLPATSRAALLVSSTFGTDSEGWLVSTIFGGPTALPTWVSSGGNPGGYISTGHQFQVNAWQAPSKFLGDQSLAYGGILQFDERDSNATSSDLSIWLSNGSIVLLTYHTFPTTSWQTSSVLLSENGVGWRRRDNGQAPTAAEFQSVLSSLTEFRLLAEYNGGNPETVDLDNVSFSSGNSTGIPEPQASSLFLGGAFIMLLVADLKLLK
jgi:hypothetical protein